MVLLHRLLVSCRIDKELVEALEDDGPGRAERLEAAARWYLGKSQLFLRLQRKGESGAAVINKRLGLFLDGKFRDVLHSWHNERMDRVTQARQLWESATAQQLEGNLGIRHLAQGLEKLTSRANSAEGVLVAELRRADRASKKLEVASAD